MSLSKKPLDRDKVLSFLILFVLLCYLAVFATINFAGFANYCTTDMYEDTLVARLMWEQKTLFPDNFLFGNQFYVIATPVLAALFYGVTGSMNLSMVLATTVMSFLILLCLNWMLKPFVKNNSIRYAALLALVASVFGPQNVVREDGQLFFVMCSFYACYLICFFYLLGDYARACESAALRPGSLILAMLLCFCTGMQSLRQTCVSVLPILCFEALRLFIGLVKTKNINLKSMSTVRAAAYLVSNLAGIVFINLLGVKRNEIYYGQSIFSGASLSSKFKDVQDAIFTVSGYEFIGADKEFFFSIIFLFFSVLILSALIYLIYKKDFSSPPAIFWWLCLISILAVIAASFVTSVSLRPIYLFTWYTLPALSLVLIGDKIKPALRHCLCLLLCLIAALNIHFSYGLDASSALKPSYYPAEQISDYAVENGFEYIYGSHSHTAPRIAVYSDGKLIAGCWEDEVPFKVSPHINIKDIYHFHDYSKALFVLREQEIEAFKTEAAGNGTEYSYHGEIGGYSLYTTTAQMMYPISENIYYAEIFPEYN